MARRSYFEPGSLYDNVDAFASALGFRNVGAIWGLAKVRWDSTQDRDAFISALIQQDYFDVIRGGRNAR